MIADVIAERRLNIVPAGSVRPQEMRFNLVENIENSLTSRAELSFPDLFGYSSFDLGIHALIPIGHPCLRQSLRYNQNIDQVIDALQEIRDRNFNPNDVYVYIKATPINGGVMD